MESTNLGVHLTEAIAECCNIFSQISEAHCSEDSILHELRTEALRLRKWNLGCSTATGDGQRHLAPNINEIHYRYAHASLARIVAGFAMVAELQSSYTKELDKGEKSTLMGTTRSRSKSPSPNTTSRPGSPSHSTQISAKLGELRFWENPKSLLHPQSPPGLAKDIEIIEIVNQALPGYCKLSWVLTDKEKYQGIVRQLKKYIDGLFDVLPPFNVPYEAPNIKQDPHFVPREYFNTLLISQIKAGAATGDISQVVLYGTGGMGKTQLVLNYVSCYHQNYSSVFWVNAASEETTKLGFMGIMQRLINFHAEISGGSSPDYGQIGQLLGMAGKLDSARSGAFNVQNPEDENHVIEAVKKWLATEGNTRWLIVFDNLDDLESFNLNNFIPSSCKHGTIIITSRRSDTGRRGFEVQQMQDHEAEILLIQSSCRDLQHMPNSEMEQEQEAIAAITQKLGYLPLALDHAGSYIFKEKCTFQSYLNQLESNISFHLSKGWKQGGDEESVFASWEMSFKVLEQRVPKATELFSICGFLDNEDISDEFLRGGLELEDDDCELEEWIKALCSYSFVKRKNRNTSFNIHPLVHMWTRKRLETQWELYVGKLSEVFQVIDSAVAYSNWQTKAQDDWDRERRYMPHLVAIEPHMAKAAVVINDTKTLDCIMRLSRVLTHHGRHNMAVRWYEWALAGYEKQLGTDHPDTLTTGNNMASVFHNQGKYDMALEWYQRALAGKEKQLGADHPHTLSTVNNMASVFDNQGKYDMALEWYQRALAGREKQLGVDHPNTLLTVNNMASVFDSQGKYDMALEWYQRALAGKEKQLGADHPSTLNTVNNMALVFDSQGKYDMALEWYQRALAGREKQLGADHPSTLTTVHSMASVFDNQGKYDMALEWYQRALAGSEKQLGADHPDTLTTVNNMALVFDNQGKYDMALEWYQRALAGREKQLGADHPSTLTTVHSMASVFDNQGKYDMALEWYQRALAGREKQLGADHPSTLTTVHSMASVFDNQGKYDMALEWYQRALAGKEKQLGADHPHTLSTVNNMASVFDNQGKYDMALEWYQRALAGSEKQLGADHPDTLTTVHSMASVFDNQGKYDMALEWYQRALAGNEKQLGADHSRTLTTVNNMASVFHNQGKYDMALEWYQRALAGSEKQLGANHPDTLTTVNNMAFVFDRQGKYDMALEWYQRALAGREKQLGADHPDTRTTIRTIIRFYQAHDMPEEAKQLRLRFPTCWEGFEEESEEEFEEDSEEEFEEE